ncbi:PAS domain-containing protein [Erythrobacteraceae bacterium CFH 75059]|nr:PAS domain-containing protein [Erythrobacteraceae bacterium CFH 75059]
MAHREHSGLKAADALPATDEFAGRSGMLFEQAMAQTRMAICLTDPNQDDQPIVFANRAFRELTGYANDEIVGHNCRFLQGPETDPAKVREIRAALESERVAVVELLNYRKDGTTFWNALHLGPIYDRDGRLLYYFGSQWDVTDVHTARAEQMHAKAMSREVSHRMKNMFSVIGGIVSVTGRSMGAQSVASRINERIQALGRAYEHTLDEAAFGTIEVGQAIRAVLRPYDPEDCRIVFKGNGVRTDPNIVSVVGLTLHELATNATKYGALSGDCGQVSVDWRHEGDRHGRQNLVIEWCERGGPPVEAPGGGAGGGTGFDIVETLLRVAKGTLDRNWDPGGLVARVVIPIGSKDQ